MKIVDLWLAIVKQLSEEEKVLGLFFCGCWMVKATSMIFVTDSMLDPLALLSSGSTAVGGIALQTDSFL